MPKPFCAIGALTLLAIASFAVAGPLSPSAERAVLDCAGGAACADVAIGGTAFLDDPAAAASVAASFDSPGCATDPTLPECNPKPPIEPPITGGECGGGGLFGSGIACRLNLIRVDGAAPEPATIALLGIALAGMGFARRRS